MAKLWIGIVLGCVACSDEVPADTPDASRSSDVVDARVEVEERDARAPVEAEQAPRDAGVPVEVKDAGVPTDAEGKPPDDARVADASLVDTTVHTTIVVAAGETYDGAGKRFRAGSELGDGSQAEAQKPIFKLESGASLRNVVLGAPAADGIHCYGDVQLANIVWEDIGEDALTIKESGTVELRGGSAEKGSDKVFQINAPSTFRVFDFRARDAGKFIRQNGGTKFKIEVHIERCDISEMDEAIFRTDSTSSTVTMIDTRYSQIGKELFIGLDDSRITQRGNSAY